MSAVSAFRESYFTSNLSNDFDYADFEGRKMRYRLLWAMVESTAYRDMQVWARSYKADYGLYKFIRSIYNPSYRLVEFWKTHLLGGMLDPMAGDGKQVFSALPILTENEKLRPAIAALWRKSNWQIKKDILSMWGASLGDVAIKVIDDPVRAKIYLKLIHPGTIKSLSLDDFGNVKGYELEEVRLDPRPKAGKKSRVRYGERASRDGDNIVYETLLDDRPYAWSGDGIDQWEEPYGFVPMVAIQHNNIGGDYGWSEIYPELSKFREVDDLASKLSDQIRKMVDAPWLMAGVKSGDVSVKNQDDASTQTTSSKQKQRQEVPIIYASDPNAKAYPLLASLDVAHTSGYIKDILKSIEADYPELSVNIQNASGDISGRALRVNQSPAANKVLQRRPSYDDAIVRAQQMAIAIGGYRNYDDFIGFGLDSYGDGSLEHSIGVRPVFQRDVLDDLEADKIFWETADAAKRAGVPLLVFLRQKGWRDEQIAEIEKSPEYKSRLAAMETLQNTGNGDVPLRRKIAQIDYPDSRKDR